VCNDRDCNRDEFEPSLWNQVVLGFVGKCAMRAECWAKYHYRVDKKEQHRCCCIKAVERQMCHTFHSRKYRLEDIPLPEVQGGTAWDWDQFLGSRVFNLFGSLQS